MTRISIGAGEILEAVEETPGILMTELIQKLKRRDMTERDLWMSLGALAYERYIQLNRSKRGGRGVTVTLVQANVTAVKHKDSVTNAEAS